MHINTTTGITIIITNIALISLATWALTTKIRQRRAKSKTHH
jgi:hypothetical protein